MVAAMLWDEHLSERAPNAPYQIEDPPVCRSCAKIAARYCPEIGRGHYYLAPRAWAITGVRGPVANPTDGGYSLPRVVNLPPATARADRAALRLVLAKGLVATLYDITAHLEPDAVAGLGVRLDEPASPRAAH